MKPISGDHVHEITIIDIFTAARSGAVRRYLQSRGK